MPHVLCRQETFAPGKACMRSNDVMEKHNKSHLASYLE